MKTTYRMLLGGLVSGWAMTLAEGAEAAKPVGGSTASLEAIVGRPDDPIGSAAAEIRQLREQLKTLLQLRAQLVLKREAAQSGLSAVEAGSDAATQHQALIEATDSGIGVLDQQIKQIRDRITFLETRVKPPAGTSAQPASGAAPHLSLGVAPPLKAVPKVAPEKIKSAAGALGTASTVDVAAARKAAAGILATSQPGATALDIDQIALLVLQQASNDANADMRAVMEEAKRENERKKALRGAVDQMKDKKDSLSELSAETSMKIKLAQDRYTKFQHALSDLQKKMADTASGIISNQK